MPAGEYCFKVIISTHHNMHGSSWNKKPTFMYHWIKNGVTHYDGIAASTQLVSLHIIGSPEYICNLSLNKGIFLTGVRYNNNIPVHQSNDPNVLNHIIITCQCHYHYCVNLPKIYLLQFGLESPNLPHSELVRDMTHHPAKQRLPNLDQICKTPWLGSLLFCFREWLTLTFKVKFNLKAKIWSYPVSTPEKSKNTQPNHQNKYHNSHDYLDCFTVPIVSQSPSSTRTYIQRLLHNCFTVSTLCKYTDLGSRGYFGV